MTLAARMVTRLVLVAVLLFCVFGFVATCEPMDPTTQLTWRWIYAVIGVMVITGLVVANRIGPKGSRGE